jgi:hypothetical protein
MVWDELGRDAEDENKKARDKWIGVYIGILAVLMAVCATGGSNAAKDATLKNIEASNLWNFFQAKNMRRHVLRTQSEELELQMQANPAMLDAAKAAYLAKMKIYADQIQLLTSDPKSNEGLDELWKKGKALEAERDIAMARDPYFDYGQALLQIAIVLASITLITGGWFLLGISGVLGVAGTLLTLNGFLMLVKVPLIG